METNWFKKVGWFYLPTTLFGFIVLLFTLAFCVNVFVVVDGHSDSVSDTLYGIFPYVVSAFSIYFWIARNTANKKKL